MVTSRGDNLDANMSSLFVAASTGVDGLDHDVYLNLSWLLDVASSVVDGLDPNVCSLLGGVASLVEVEQQDRDDCFCVEGQGREHEARRGWRQAADVARAV